MAPLVLGIVLGDPLDKSFRRGMTPSDGGLEPFLTRPISALLAFACFIMVLATIPPVRRWFANVGESIAGRFRSRIKEEGH